MSVRHTVRDLRLGRAIGVQIERKMELKDVARVMGFKNKQAADYFSLVTLGKLVRLLRQRAGKERA